MIRIIIKQCPPPWDLAFGHCDCYLKGITMAGLRACKERYEHCIIDPAMGRQRLNKNNLFDEAFRWNEGKSPLHTMRF